MRFRHNEHSLRVVDVLESDGRGLNLTEPVRDGILNHTSSGKPVTLEGRVVRIMDRVAYINHDIDDALRAGIIAQGDLPAEQIELLGETGAQRIDLLVQDMVERSRAEGDIAQSDDVGGAMLRLRKFMFDRVYLGEEARAEQERARVALRTLFDHYLANLEEVPATDPDAGPVQRVTDYIAGMTDRFCLSTYDQLVARQ
jgi:dGTPase